MPMTYATPVISTSKNNKMKRNVSGPRAETLMLIRHFARVYEFEPEHTKRVKSNLVN